MTLDGQGSDEMTAGYLTYVPVYVLGNLFNHPFVALREHKNFRDIVHFSYYLSRLTLFLSRLTNRRLKQLLFSRDLKIKVPIKEFSRPPTLKLDKVLRQDTFLYSLPTLLRYADRNAMAHSVESRMPFLDFRLVDFLLVLPSSLKIHGLDQVDPSPNCIPMASTRDPLAAR